MRESSLRLVLFPIFLFAPLTAAVGCGSVTPAASDAGGLDAPIGDTADAAPSEGRIGEACAALAKAVCDTRVACSNQTDATGVGIIRMFGTKAECLTRQALLCVTKFRAS